MTRALAWLLVLALAACAGGGSSGPHSSGPYLGGSLGGNTRGETRLR